MSKLMKEPYNWSPDQPNVTMDEINKGHYYQGRFRGADMHTHIVNSVYKDKEYLAYPPGIEKKIKSNQWYDVYAWYHDAADPMDSSCSYAVIYVE